VESNPLATQAPQQSKKPRRTIALEEHYATPAFWEGPGRQLRNQSQSANPQAASQAARIVDQASDLDDGRIAAMDAAGVDVQVLSLHSPGVEQLEVTQAIELSHDANDRLAEAVRRHPSRFAGLATLPTTAPDIAAKELERTVHNYGFKGAMINGHSRGRYLDDKFFWPILECAEALRVPLCLHPTPPPQQVIETSYTGNYAPEVTAQVASAAWGWHIETAIHVLRLILSGAFDRYPNLQLVIGHLGEGLPFMLPRLNLTLPREISKLDRSIGEYLRENVFYTISGFNFTSTFLDLLFEVGVERIMFSADYPWGSMQAACAFLENLPISPSDKEKIAHGNAEQLLKI
jgi:predicted TIM-barrel fold metal-dependent hydrolase